MFKMTEQNVKLFSVVNLSAGNLAALHLSSLWIRMMRLMLNTV